MEADRAADQKRVQERELTTALTLLRDTLGEMHRLGMAKPDLEDRDELKAVAAERGISLEVTD
jgi:hypothetical protein